MAARIKEEFNVESKLVRGRDGIFDVIVDETLIYSKHETGRFPEEEQVIDSIRKHCA